MKAAFDSIGRIAIMASVGLGLAGAPALAQGTSTGGASTGGSASTSSGAGAGDAYNFEVPKPASATCCGNHYDHSNANGNADIIMKNFNQKLAAVQLAIIEALRLGTGQLSGNMREQTGANHTLADQQDDRATVKSVEDQRIKAMMDAATGATSCGILSGSRGGGIEAQAQLYRAALSKSLAEHSRGAKGTPASKSVSYALEANIQAHCDSFATEEDVAFGICSAGSKVGELAGTDLDAGHSLFFAQGGKSMSHDPERQLAVTAFINHAVIPLPPGRFLADEGRGGQNKERAAKRAAALARNSIAQDLLADLASRRVPTQDNKLKQWGSSMASAMAGYSGMDLSKGISKNDWLAIYSRGFLLNPEEGANSNQNPAVAIKDIRNIMSVQAYQNFENYLLLEKIAANLAIQTSMMVEQSRGVNMAH